MRRCAGGITLRHAIREAQSATILKYLRRAAGRDRAEKIKAATAESLCKAWQNLLKTAKFEILYIGDSPADKAKEVFAKAFANIERNVVTSSTDVVKNVSKEKHITEEMELSQSKLVMGFRTQIFRR